MQKLSLALIATLVVGCSSTPPATEMSFDQLDDKANNDKRITVVGYPQLPSMALVTDTMGVDLYEQPGGKGRHLRVSIPVGSSKNQLEKPPKNYTPADLKIHAKDGVVLGTDQKLKVTGMMTWWPPEKPGQPGRYWMTAPFEFEKL